MRVIVGAASMASSARAKAPLSPATERAMLASPSCSNGIASSAAPYNVVSHGITCSRARALSRTWRRHRTKRQLVSSGGAARPAASKTSARGDERQPEAYYHIMQNVASRRTT